MVQTISIPGPVDEFTPQLFGAVGDGVANDYTAIQAAIAYVITNRVPLHFPDGTYCINQKLLIDPATNRNFGIKLIGSGKRGAIIKATASMTAMVEYAATSAANRQETNLIDGVSLDGNALAQKGYYSPFCAHSSFRNFRVSGTTVAAIDWAYGFSNVYDDIELLLNTGDGLYLGSATGQNNAIDIRGCKIYLNDGWGLVLRDSSSINVTGSTFESNKKGGIYAIGNVIGLNVSGNYIEYNGVTGQAFTSPDTVTVKADIIINGSASPTTISAAFPSSAGILNNFIQPIADGSGVDTFIFAPGSSGLEVFGNDASKATPSITLVKAYGNTSASSAGTPSGTLNNLRVGENIGFDKILDISPLTFGVLSYSTNSRYVRSHYAENLNLAQVDLSRWTLQVGSNGGTWQKSSTVFDKDPKAQVYELAWATANASHVYGFSVNAAEYSQYVGKPFVFSAWTKHPFANDGNAILWANTLALGSSNSSNTAWTYVSGVFIWPASGTIRFGIRKIGAAGTVQITKPVLCELGSDSDALAAAIPSVGDLNTVVTPQMFGAVGNGVANDTAALNAAAAAARGGVSAGARLVIPSGRYLATSELDFTRVRFIECFGEIVSSVATSGQAAVKIGTESSANVDMVGGDILLNVTSSLAANTTLTGVTGIRVKGSAQCKYRLLSYGWDVGIELAPVGGVGTQYIAFNEFEVFTNRCHTGLKFNGTYASSNGWINQNTFIKSDCYPQNDTITGDSTGIHFAGTGGYSSNNNIFLHASLEGQEVPIYFENAFANRFISCRLETAGPVRFGRSSYDNVVDALYQNGINGITQTWDAERPNVITLRDSAWIPELLVSYEDFFAVGTTVHSRKLKNSVLGTMQFTSGVLNSTARTFVGGANHNSYALLRVKKGDIFRVHGYFVSGTTVLALYARDASDAALAALSSGAVPYLGTNATPAVSGTSQLTDFVALTTSLANPFMFSVNRDEVVFVRIQVPSGVALQSLFVERLVHGGQPFDAQLNAGFDNPAWNAITGRGGQITPQMFGAVGDGVADDTAAIQAAINLNRGLVASKQIYIPAGTYLVTAPISVWSGTSITGDGTSSLLKASGAIDCIFRLQGGFPVAGYANYIDIDNLKFETTGATWAIKGDTVTPPIVTNSTFTNLHFNCAYCVDLSISYTQFCTLQNWVSVGPAEQFLKLRGNFNRIESLDKEGTTGTSTEPYIHLTGAVGFVVGNSLKHILLEQTGSVNKVPIKFENAGATIIEDIWIEVSTHNGYALECVNSSVRIRGVLTWPVSSKLRAITNSRLDIEKLPANSQDLDWQGYLEADASSQINIGEVYTRRGNNSHKIAGARYIRAARVSNQTLQETVGGSNYAIDTPLDHRGGQNLFVNPSFEAGMYGWTISSGTPVISLVASDFATGLMLQISSTVTFNLYQTITVPAAMVGRPFTMRYCINVVGGTTAVVTPVIEGDVGGNALNRVLQDTGHQVMTVTRYVSAGGSLTFGIGLVTLTGSTVISLDEFSLTPGTEALVNPSKFGSFELNGLTTIAATVAPTTGTWKVGDHCRNSVPVVGQPKGWFCTVAGTPGTWVSEGVL